MENEVRALLYFWRKKNKRYLPGPDIPTLIIPYLFAKHWSIFILSEEYFIHFDSMWAAGLHEQKYVHTYIVKFWATWRGFEVGSAEWKSCYSPDIWEHPCILQQYSNWDCRYYYLKCIMEYCSIKRRKKSKHVKINSLYIYCSQKCYSHQTSFIILICNFIILCRIMIWYLEEARHWEFVPFFKQLYMI